VNEFGGINAVKIQKRDCGIFHSGGVKILATAGFFKFI
jgi:hypothetical protein